MSNDTTPDEHSKRRVAKRVIADKRQYFVPAHSRTVEADSPEEAVTKAAELAKAEAEEGDG